MVKGRESCRRVIQSYEIMRAAKAAGATPETKLLLSANMAASQMLEHFNGISNGARTLAHLETDRQYASKLVTEIKDMLEKAMMLERETRRLVRAAS